MSRRYYEAGEQNAAAATSVLGLAATSTVRPVIYMVLFGSADAPADQAFSMKMQRFTAPGTGTAVTPNPLDSGDPAATGLVKHNHTVEPTYTASSDVLSFPINQQATFQWMVPAEEGGIVLPATANAGVALFFNAVSGGTALCQGNFAHQE